MAEESIRSTGEYGSYPTLLAADFSSSKDENPTMKGAEAADPEPMGEPTLGDTQVEELPPCDDAVLASQQPPDLAILSRWDRYSGPK